MKVVFDFGVVVVLLDAGSLDGNLERETKVDYEALLGLF
jgi:hypothetical protein